jgi:putative ABC transport system permease protein
MTVMVRSEGDPLALAPAVRDTVLNLDKDQPIADVRTMEDLLSASLARTRFATLLMAAFAAMAMLLAALGIYGVVSYLVAERTHEIGIRVALGSSYRGILRMLMRQGMVLVGMGIGIGTVASLALAGLLKKLLYGIRPADPLTLGTVALALGSVALLACYLAARRAGRVDPITALRME